MPASRGARDRPLDLYGVASSRYLELRSKLIYYPRVAGLAHYAVCKLQAKGRSEAGTI